MADTDYGTIAPKHPPRTFKSPLVPTPVVSTPLKEPEQNPKTSMDKVQKPSSENTAQVPPPEDHDSIFIEIPKPKAKKTVQEPNSPEPNSYQPKLPYPERMKVREKDKPSAPEEQKSKNKQFAHAISVIDFSKDEPFSGSTTNHSDALPPSSSPVKTSDNLEEFADELTLLKKGVHEENFQDYSNPIFEFDDNFNSSNENPLFNEIDEDVENKNSNVLDSDEPVLLNTPLSDKVECSDPEDNMIESKLSSHGFILILRRLFRVRRRRVENNDSEDEDNELPNLDHQDNPSSPRPPPEPPDVCLNFKPDTA
ncbi:hypothetical protein Tco_1123271 [Tanacetum coccineum]|uniref:Uncharacterized protein n=1 Tax=Tanacetum coccineum TaxID=301880 RepID=A0ABQ5J3E5_9ASTR